MGVSESFGDGVAESSAVKIKPRGNEWLLNVVGERQGIPGCPREGLHGRFNPHWFVIQYLLSSYPCVAR